MKYKDSGPGGSIFKKKGFFISLYACLGSVIVLALVISFSNLANNGANSTAQDMPDEESVSASSDTVRSYQDQMGDESDTEESWLRNKPQATPTPQLETDPTPRPPTPTPFVVPSYPPVAPSVTSPSADSADAEADTREVADVDDYSTEQPAPNAESFTPFAEGDKMIWPVQGELAMAFSMDRLVYDPTLDQYRTNDDIRINAQEGTPVKASFGGQVVEINRNNVYGNYVVLDNGNGWSTTYGQLMDKLLVKEGDIVKAGQVIGGVGKPSIYGSLNGPHVNLRVTKENEPVDPRTVLVSQTE